MWKKIIIGLAALIIVVFAVALYFDIPRFVIGLMTYGQQVREGSLEVGATMPLVTLYELDGETKHELYDALNMGRKPLVLIFGSFT